MRAPAGERLTFAPLLWLAACLGLTLLAGIRSLPAWVTLAVAAVTALRLVLAARGGDAPPRGIRLLISGLTILFLFGQFHTFNGLTAGTALLSLIAGLKLLETRTRRDVYVVTMIIYFLSLATLLEGESFWLLTYLIAVCWLTTATLLRLTGGSTAGVPAAGHWRGSVGYAGRLLAQALPLAAASWLFFPRFGGPLWQLPDSGATATTGLSDAMSPGDITDLALSEEVAFRARFMSAPPPPAARYWRGPVLHDFDGHSWRRGDPGAARVAALRYQGAAYRYRVILEPNVYHWIFALDWPARTEAPRAYVNGDSMVVQPNPGAEPRDVVAVSYGEVRAVEALPDTQRAQETQLPRALNPRTLRLAETLRAAHPENLDYVQAVLGLFHTQAFYYTLTPPRLAENSVDAFLFDTRRGFCGHYASAFAVLMRAAGIPAHVVTGYQGGTFNRFADYWILRQSDAHAWDEVWIEGQGWRRVDPTAAIAPERVERGLNDIAAAGAAAQSRWQQRTPWFTDARLRLDALRLLWRERILRYDQGSQEQLLAFMHVPEPDGGKLALVLAVCLIAGMSWLTWQVRREIRTGPADPLARAFATLCRRLAVLGLVRLPHEGADAFAARVAAARPDLASTVSALCREYTALRYGRAGSSFGDDAGTRGSRHGRGATPGAAAPARTPPPVRIRRFIAAVRRFRPRRRPGPP